MRIYVSNSVSNFENKIDKTWGLDHYDKNNKQHRKEPVVFFGLYLDDDYLAAKAHEGKLYIFWCGSDLLGLLRTPRLQQWLGEINAEHWVENEVEANDLRQVGIDPNIEKSFLNRIYNFYISYKQNKKPNLYLCYHEDREDLYGIGTVKRIASRVNATFHIYGGKKDVEGNIFWHGKVPEEEFNTAIRNYQAALRCGDHDGFSEILAKSALMGQYPISRIPYEKVWHYSDEESLIKRIQDLAKMKEPNLEAREYYLHNLNKFPWLK